ncbi:MAG: hypothetical protein WBM08_15145, partial [Prochlorococcaceae cyanobacterium]
PGEAAVLRPSSLVWELDSEPVLPLVVQIPGEAGVPLTTAGATPSAATPSASGQPETGKPPADRQPPPRLIGVPVIEPFPSPYIGGALPSAYVAGWGDYFISGSAATPGKLRDGVVDASLNMGIGFGDPVRFVAVEVDWNIGSVRNFNYNGSFDVLIGRMLVNEPRLQVSVSGGLTNVVQYYRNELPSVPNGYGVITLATPLRTPNPYFNQVLQVSLGVGGSNYAYINDDFEAETTSFFAALGLEITSNVGLSLGWSGRGTNVNLSYTPFRDLPVTINAVAADVFNRSPFGTVGVFSLTWGDNFRTGLF